MDFFIEDYGVSPRGAVALEDSVMQKGKPVTAGSGILKGFVSPLEAEVVSRLKKHGIDIAGVTAMDEFGAPRISAAHPERVSGAVNAVAENRASFALCNDLFGTVRRQAAEKGVCYIHPTYGTVSRYGLIPLACSMDQIGIVCDSAAEGFGLLSKLAGRDEKDGAMLPSESYSFEKEDRKIKLGIPENVWGAADGEAREAMRELAGRFGTASMELEYCGVYSQVMYILACAEISNNISRYDGIKFGYRAKEYRGVNDLYVKTRTESFGPDVKLMAIMGSMALSREWYEPLYEKAMKIRGLIRRSLDFGSYDAIILPVTISKNPYENIALYALPQLAGLPGVSFSYRGQGLQLVADVCGENALLTALEVLS